MGRLGYIENLDGVTLWRWNPERMENIQHPMASIGAITGCRMLDVGGWMFPSFAQSLGD